MARARSPRATPPHSLGLYSPGDSWLHRAPAGSKLLGLLLLGLALTLAPAAWTPVLGSATLVALSLAALAVRLPVGALVRALRGVLIVVAAVGAYQVWRAGWEVAVGVGSTLLALVLAGFIVTMTTPVSETVDVVVQLARPLRRVGLDPQWIGLAVGLMLRGIPTLLQVFTDTRDAARARGLDRNPRAVLVPAALRTVAHARRTGDALAARGIAD